jgi:uncharacterized protein YebE (UPF0316 family)
MITIVSVFSTLLDSQVFRLLIIPLLIFTAQVVDVGLSTIGLIFTARGFKKLSAVMSFFEIIIYLIAISAILEHLSEWHFLIAYALGYAVGTYVGMWIEEKLSIGFLSIRFITRKNPERFLKSLRRVGYKPTFYGARSSAHRVHVVHTVVKRKELTDLTDRIARFDRAAFYAIEDIRQVSVDPFAKRLKRA